MPRFIHIADLHIGTGFPHLEGQKRKNRQNDLLNAFTRVVDFALEDENRIEALWIAGDLFDCINPEEALVDKVIDQLVRLEEGGKESFIIPGSHDPAIYPDSVYRTRTLPGCTLLNSPNMGEPVERIYGDTPFYFYGMEYHPILTKKPYDEFKAKNLPGFHVALLHGSLKVAVPWKADETYLPLSPKGLGASGMNYLALGHYHNCSRYKVGNIDAVYPGTLEGLTFEEKGDRFLVIVEMEKGKDNKIIKHLWNKKNINKLKIDLLRDNIEEVRDIINYLRSYADKNLLMDVVITGPSEFTIDGRHIEKLLENFFFYLKIHDQSDFISSETVAGVSRERSVRGLFTRKILNLMDKIQDKNSREAQLLKEALKMTLPQLMVGESDAV